MSKAKRDARKQKSAVKKAAGKGLAGKVQKVLKKVQVVASDTPFLPLLFAKKMMVNALKKKNVSHDGSLKDIATKFHSFVVKKGHFNNAQYHVVPVAVIAGIVKAIVEFIKNLKEKKDKAEADAEEAAMVADAAAGATELKEAAEANDAADPDTKEDSGFGSVLIILAILITIGLLMRNK